jgi:hypothetical protein
MKKIHWVIVACLGIALAMFFLLQQSCDLGEQVGKLKGQLKVEQANSAILKKDMESLRKDKDAIIEGQNKKIDALLANAGKPTQAEKDKDKEIAKLKESWSSLSVEAQAKLHELDRAWSDKFTLAENRHKDDLFNLNHEWQVKFDAQVVICDSWKKQYNDSVAIGATKDALISKLNIKLKTTRILSKAETVALAVAGGYIVYNAVKK